MSGHEGKRRLWQRPFAVVTTTATALLLSAGVAFAVVSATANVNTIGMGGYNVNTPGITENQEVVQPDQYSLAIQAGRQGIGLCNSVTGDSAKLGLFSNNLTTVFQAQWAVASAPGCPANGPLTGTTIPALSAVPFNHHVWLNETLVTKVKRITILVCILEDKNTDKPAPMPTDTGAPSDAPLGQGQDHVPGLGDVPGTQDKLHGDFFKCFIIHKVIKRQTILFEAQDLDAPTGTPVAGDLAGVQTVVVPLGPIFHHTVVSFDNATWGASENTATLVGCTGNGFPAVLAGPAAYTSGACQPISVGEYATYTAGLVVSPLTGPATATELVSPNNTDALMAPNNSLSAVNTGPHGTASDASTSGGHYALFTANVPES
jgi:hypothetical protein